MILLLYRISRTGIVKRIDMLKSFKEYIFKTTGKGRYNEFFDFRLDEMAEERQVVRKSVQFDQDDIDFLKQFNYNLWGQALHQRYEMLFKQIEKLHEIKTTRGFKELIVAIKNFLKERSEETAREIMNIPEPFGMSEEEIETINTSSNPLYTRGLTDDEFNNLAEKYANDHFYSKNEDNAQVVDDPNSVDFIFKDIIYIPRENGEPPEKLGGKRSGKDLVVKAHPYLRRLYHKLERTKGQEHLHGSGLEGTKGKYGFELRDPVRGTLGEPNVVRGMQFPTENQINRAVKRYMELNAHRVLGDFDNSDPKIKWMDTGYEDTFERVRKVEKYKNIVRQEKRLIRGEATDIKEDEIEKEAIKRLVADFKNKKVEIKSPPYPPNYPQGIDANLGIRKVKGENREDIIGPPLFLPFKNDGGKLVPIVKKSHFYREIEPGEIHDPNIIVGHKKDFIKITDDIDPSGKKISKDGGLFLNHNTAKKMTLIKGTPAYHRAFEVIMSNQPMASHRVQNGEASAVIDQSGDMYFYILKGVVRCINNLSCGGKTDHEKCLMLQNVPLIYNFALKYIENNFDNPLFFVPDNNEYKKGTKLRAAIVNMAHTATNLLSQKSWSGGGGTRRRRAQDAETRQTREEKPLFSTRIKHTGDYNDFPYDPVNMSNYLKDLAQLESEAREAEEKSKAANDKRKDTNISKEELGNLIMNMSYSTTAVVEDLTMMLASFYRSANTLPPKIAQQNAESQIEAWEKEGYDLNRMIIAFKDLPVVKAVVEKAKLVAPTGNIARRPNAMIQNQINDAIADLNAEKSRMPEAAIRGKFLPQGSSKFSAYVIEIGKYLESDPQFTEDSEGLEEVLVAVQNVLTKTIEGVSPTAPTAPAIPTTSAVTPQSQINRIRKLHPDKVNYFLLMRAERTPENLFNIVFDPKFSNAYETTINAVKSRINAIKDKFRKEDYDMMMDKIKELIELKKGDD
jgi:hypothetical protein